MRHDYYPPGPLPCPPDSDGWTTVFHYPQYRNCPQWPWLYKEKSGQRKPVDYDQSKAACTFRGENSADWQI